MDCDASELSAADRFDLRDLYADYAWALSTHDREALSSLFVRRARVALGPARSYEGEGDEIAGLLLADWAAEPGAPGRQHWVNQLQVHGCGERASARGFVLTPALTQIGTPAATLFELGVVRDSLVKHGGRWYFVEREFSPAEPASKASAVADDEAVPPQTSPPAHARPSSPVGPEDRAEIDELYARYAWSLDNGESAEFAELFTADGVIEDPAGRFEGRSASGIAGFIVDLHRNNPTFRGRQHWIAHTQLRGIPDRVTARSFTLVPSRQASGATNIHLVAYYDDVLVPHRDRWLFYERIVRRWEGAVLARFPEYRPLGEAAGPPTSAT